MIIFILLNILDCLLTYIGITTNKATELNLLLSKFFEKNIFLGLGIKMLLAIILALVIRKWKPNLFKILNIAFVVIVVWNLICIIL